MIRILIVLASLLTLMTGCFWSTTDPQPSGPAWGTAVIATNTSIQPVAVVVADMDSDGDLDVVSAWRGSPVGSDNVVFGLIAIHFQQDPATWSTVVIDEGLRYAEVNAITVADVDLDQNPDILVALIDRILYQQAPDDPDVVAEWKLFEIQASIGDTFLAWYDVTAGQIDGEDGLDIVAALADDGRVVWFKAPHAPDD